MSTEIITESEGLAADLQAAAAAINETIDLITAHEDAFNESTLEPRLLIGLEIAKAQEAFGLNPPERTIPTTLSRRDNVPAATSNPLGFSAWISKNIPRLNRSTAIKYATAFRSLGISTHDATTTRIRAKIKDLRHQCGKNNLPMPSLAMLYKQGRPPKQDLPRIESKPDPEDIAGEGRVQLHEWMTTWDNIVRLGYLEPLTAADLQPVADFLTTCRDNIRARIKSSR